MRNSWPQRYLIQQKSLKVKRNATTRNKRLNKPSTKTFAENFFKLSYNTHKVHFLIKTYVSLSSIYELMTNCNRFWAKATEIYQERPGLTS